jgi:hypothetical protein
LLLRIYKADSVMVDLKNARLDYLQKLLVVTSTRKLVILSGRGEAPLRTR